MLIPLFLVHSWRTTTSHVFPTASPMWFSHRTPSPSPFCKMVSRSSTKDKSSISVVVRALPTVKRSGSPATTLSRLSTNGLRRSTPSGTMSSPSLPTSSHTTTLPSTTLRNCSLPARVTLVPSLSPSTPMLELAHRTRLSSSMVPTLHSSQTNTSSTWSAAPSTKPMPAVMLPSRSTTVSQLFCTLLLCFTAPRSAVKTPPKKSPCPHQHPRTSLARAPPSLPHHSTYLPLLLF